MNKERPSLDSELIDMLAYFISGSIALANFVNVWGKTLALDQELTKEQKLAIKKDMKWTSESLKFLTEAGRSYRSLQKNLEFLGATLDKKIPVSDYDDLIKGTNEIVSLVLIYCDKVWQNPQAVKDIREFLLAYGGGTDKDVETAYKYFMSKAIKL